jgi:subtilisin family serine protease
MFFRKVFQISLLFFSFSLIAQESSFVKGQVFVKFKTLERADKKYFSPNDLTPDLDYYLSHPSVKRVVDYYGLQDSNSPFTNIDGMNSTFVLNFLSLDIDDIIGALEESGLVEYAEKVPLMETSQLPNDVNIRQWEHNAIDSKLAWGEYYGQNNVVLAIVDDAVLLSHEDLKDNIWVNPGEIPNNNIDDDKNGYVDDINGWDAADRDNDPNPPANATSSHFSHGTHCAGTAGARTDNGKGIASLAGKAKIMAVKTKYSNSTGGSLQAAYSGLAYAIAANADVISMSWGSYYFSRTYQQLITSAHEKGIIMIAAAGNNNTESLMYPAGYSHVVAVGASTQSDSKASFSNYGSHIDVMAPGVSIYSTVPGGNNDNYSYKSGTSMACPLVASLATYLLSRNPDLTPDDILSCLSTNADYIDDKNLAYANLLGAGRVNVYKSLSCSSKIIAKFEMDSRDACPGTKRAFRDLTTNNPISWKWSFPGGSPSVSTLQNPTVSYSSIGTFDVQLIAANAEGKDTFLLRNYINVSNPSATMGGDIVIYPGTKGYVEVSFTGTAPFSFTYSDGPSIKSIDNISTSPYYLEVGPSSTTTYSLVSMRSAECSGTVSGRTTVEVSQSAIPCYNLISKTKVSQGNGGFDDLLQDHDGFGSTIAVLDDYDGDGVPELAVGKNWNTTNKFWIMYMNSNGTIKSKKEIYATQFNGSTSRFARKLEAIGDVDGNGYIDLAVSNYTNNGGEVIVMLMGADATVIGYNTIGSNKGGMTETFEFGEGFGNGLGHLGDFNKDGIPDLAVYSKLSTSQQTEKSISWLLYLDKTGMVSSYTKIDHATSGITFSGEDGFGHDIENIGDLDDDGVDDLAFSHSNYFENEVARVGRIMIAFMNADGSIKKWTEITDHSAGLTEPVQSNINFGEEIEPVGDINNDGIEDILVSRPGSMGGTTDRSNGGLFLLFLNKDGSVKEYHVIDETRGNLGINFIPGVQGPYIGTAVESLGDINNDGGMDFAVGARGTNDGGTRRGAYYIFNLQPFCEDNCELKADFDFSNVCIGEEVSFKEEAKLGDGDITTREWTINGSIIKDSIEFSYLFDAPGRYTVQLLMADNSDLQCRDSISYTVEVESNIDFTVSEEELPCLGDSIFINVTDEVCSQGPYMYEWSGHSIVVGEKSPELMFLPLEDMVLTVKVTDFFGTSKTKNIIIDVDESCCYSRAIIEQPKEYYCLGESVSLINKSIARFTPSYEWFYDSSLGKGSVKVENIEPLNFPVAGKFQVQLVQKDLCKSDTTIINIHVMELPHSALEDKEVCTLGDSIGVAAISSYEYEWSPKTGLDNPYDGMTYVSNSTVSTYTLSITDVLTQCSSSDEINVTNRDCILSVSDVNDSKLGVYPNPVADELNVNLNFELLEVYSVTGTFIGQYHTSVIPVSKLAKGIYILKVIDKQNAITNYQFVKY